MNRGEKKKKRKVEIRREIRIRNGSPRFFALVDLLFSVLLLLLLLLCVVCVVWCVCQTEPPWACGLTHTPPSFSFGAVSWLFTFIDFFVICRVRVDGRWRGGQGRVAASLLSSIIIIIIFDGLSTSEREPKKKKRSFLHTHPPMNEKKIFNLT
ncbi:hypothetical protein B0F90DRAFT_8477 [Multifurca ochricompacta]|uniref:Uncharacterized protein n=1 Tax=Multifurca ochricompacta TaxID=376703 RepID=A0AAD4MCC2_9AGAM|nr:hypothetical protein B0F90DRAFT_8477 [Multifurca ochricompacta]